MLVQGSDVRVGEAHVRWAGPMQDVVAEHHGDEGMADGRRQDLDV